MNLPTTNSYESENHIDGQLQLSYAKQNSEQLFTVESTQNHEPIPLRLNDKVKDLDELARLISTCKAENKTIIHCHGCFDLLHIGHIRYFEQAKRMGDILVVTITPDCFIDKGPHRPAFIETLRAEAVASLNCVDYVAINKWPTAVETLQLLKPDIYVKGSDVKSAVSDPTGKLAMEEKVADEIGTKMVFTNDVVFSSTHLINRFISNFPKDVQQYLEIFKTRYKLGDVIELIDRMASLRVLIIGDTILDDYHYCRTLGVSSKDPALALQHESNDMFAGGVLAVANHVAGFTNEVRLVSVLGKNASHEDFIRLELKSNIIPFFAYQDNAPTTIKRRFVEGYSYNKLFEVYIMDDSGLPEEKEEFICDLLQKEFAGYDLVIASDFGHGAISNNMRKLLSHHAPFLSVNTQANAGNRGFHTISRYDRADYVSIAEGEIRLEFRDIKNDIKPMINEISSKIGSKYFAVTQGKKGCTIKNQNDRFIEVPSFASKIIDRVGAGDAFLSITSLAAYLGAPAEIIGFIGNIVGGLTVEVLGNQKSMDKMSVKNFITSLLK